MNEAWAEDTAIYALTMTFLEEPPKKEESKELQVIESEQVLEGEVEEIAPPPFYRRPIPRRWAILLCSCLLIISTIASTMAIIILTMTATIEVVIVKRPVSFQQDFTIPITHTLTNTKTLSQTTKATGIAHQDATNAIGSVTFYNSLPASQAVPAGTLLIGVDGMHIITDSIAYIPPGNFSTNGQVTVVAHVTTPGSQGNIAAGDFSGACCRDYVFARTSQFRSGQDARDFTVVSQSDVDGPTKSLSTQTEQQIQGELSGKTGKLETLTPLICSQIVTSDTQVGEEAQEVTVHLTKTCSAVSYDKADFMNQVVQKLHQIVGKNYISVDSPQVSILTTSVKENAVKITAVANGMVIYHFRKADMDKLKRLIAGKSKEQAGQIILKWRDIRLTGIQLQFSQGNLPSDPERIRVNVKP